MYTVAGPIDRPETLTDGTENLWHFGEANQKF